MSQTELSPKTASLALVDGSLALREHTWWPEAEYATSRETIFQAGMGPTSKVMFQTHQGLEAIPRSPFLIATGDDSSEALPSCRFSRLKAVCLRKLSSECPRLHAGDSNEGSREAMCSLPVHDPEKQSAHKPRHLGPPVSLERDRAPGIIGTSSLHIHSGIQELLPLQLLLEYLNFHAFIVGRSPQPAQHGYWSKPSPSEEHKAEFVLDQMVVLWSLFPGPRRVMKREEKGGKRRRRSRKHKTNFLFYYSRKHKLDIGEAQW